MRSILFSIQFLLLALTTVVNGQVTTNQFWFEYYTYYPLANAWQLRNNFTYRTLLGSPRWEVFEYEPTVEYSIVKTLDFLAGATIAYTVQTPDYHSLEIRPMIGTRLHITPQHRVQLRMLFRLEQRNFQNLETKKWQRVFRPRIRAEFLIPLNKDSFAEDGLWYLWIDFEWLMAVDSDTHERFANRFCSRFAVGYRLSYTFRFEAQYMNQQSRNHIAESFDTSDNVVRLCVKHYLRKGKS